MKYPWRDLFSAVSMMCLAGAVIHGFIGNPYAAATHVFIGTIATGLRGMCE